MAKSSPPRRGAKALVYNDATKARLADLGAVQYSPTEVAEDFGVSETDLADFFNKRPSARAIYEQALADARRRLRATQIKLAEKSPTMAVFLGKYYLGQAERRELNAHARAAEIAENAQFVRAALAALAADPGPEGDGGGGGDGAG